MAHRKECILTTDHNGNKWLIDEDGNKFVPVQTNNVTSKEGEFTTYNTSQGHCGLCGSLTCNGHCFK